MSRKTIEFDSLIVKVFSEAAVYVDNEWVCPSCYGHNIIERLYSVQFGVIEHVYTRVLQCQECRRHFATEHSVDAVVFPIVAIVNYLEDAWNPHL